MTLPWKQLRWVTALPIEDCAERLMAAAGADRRSSAALVITRIERTVTLSVASRMRHLASRPYLHAVLVERAHGTLIVGRFNPDALVIAAGMCAIVLSALPVAAVLTVGISSLSRVSFSWFGTVSGLTSSLLVVTFLVIGAIRASGWRRHCQMISSTLEEACSATPIDPRDV